ncbi:MAG TPA: hypothetical protein VIK91_16210 [Nannocystis sp.]
MHQRELAALIDAREPGWTVIYGPWSRAFFAFAAWPAPQGLMVTATKPAGLVAEMRAAEAAHGAALSAPAWGNDRQIRQAGWDRPWR